MDKRRLREHMGKLDETMMKQVDGAIAVSFGLLEPVIVLHAVHLKLFPPKVVVIRKHLLTPRVHAIVQRPQIEHIIKHIVTCQNHAARGYGAHSPRLTQARIIVKKRRAIILCAAVKPQGIGHYI